MTELIVFVAVVLVIAVAGGVLGMLLVPRLERMTEPPDEDTGAGDDHPRD